MIFKIGVENLLTIYKDFDLTPFYNTKIKIDDYGGEAILKKLDKKKLCNWICEKESIPKQKKIFAKFNSVFDTIEKVLKDEK